MLELDAIQTYYGESHILHGVSIRVGEGEAVVLLGRNGAGKTTLIRSVAGFTPPREGRVVFGGQPVQTWPAYRIARLGLALVPQGRRIFSPLTVSENLTLGARPGEWTLERVYALFPRLGERALQPGGTLSGGEQQMLAIARALMTNGRMLVLDEPSEGLAPLIVRQIGRIVRGLKGGRLTIKGAKSGDFPVEQPEKFELVINLKTAKALGLTRSPSLVLRTDEIGSGDGPVHLCPNCA